MIDWTISRKSVIAIFLFGICFQSLFAEENTPAIQGAGSGDGTAAARAKKPTEHGLLLYSWKKVENGNDVWSFSLLPRTDKKWQYAINEITADKGRINGVENLKKTLGALAEGEIVMWRFSTSYGVTKSDEVESIMTPPEDDFIKQISMYCESIKIVLRINRC